MQYETDKKLFQTTKLSPVDRYIMKNNRLRIYNTVVNNLMVYGAEIWILNGRNKIKINSVEMNFCGWSYRDSRIDRVTSEEIGQKDTLDLFQRKASNMIQTCKKSSSKSIDYESNGVEPTREMKNERRPRKTFEIKWTKW